MWMAGRFSAQFNHNYAGNHNPGLFMASQVLIAQPASKSSQTLVQLFEERRDQVYQATSPAEVFSVMKQTKPALVVVDLHMPGNGWQEVLPSVQRQYPDIKFLFTSAYPDPEAEITAREKYGARTFLRQPFTQAELEQALQATVQDTAAAASTTPALPRVRVPMRMKITLPYMLLALALAAAAAYVISQVVFDTIEERFTNQLIEAGKLSQDWIVQEENRLLETLRLVAYTQGVPEAITAGDADALLRFTLPAAINSQEDAIEILNQQGVSVLSVRRSPGGDLEDYIASRGDVIYTQWPFVQKVLDRQVTQGRDKFSGPARAPWGDYFYVAGPVTDENGAQVGLILVGRSLPEMVRKLRQDTLSHATIYDLNGQPIASTLLIVNDPSYALDPDMVSTVLERRADSSLTRRLGLASVAYTEIIGPWQLRRFPSLVPLTPQEDIPGLLGVTLPETFLVHPSRFTRVQIFLLTTVAFLAVIGLGVFLANRITRPLLNVVDASARVAQGDLDVRVDSGGNDEIAVLAHSFNHMVLGLREGSIYRDLLGRTVSPEVREELRERFASGELRLEGQDATATVLVADIHGFTTLSETEDSSTVLSWLNEYFEEIIPFISARGGVINNFEGDALAAFFGILPRSLPAQDSAYQACRAASDILKAIRQLNTRRAGRAEPPFTVGLGINTGPVAAGALGSVDRLHYTVIGDVVNTSSHLQSFTRQLGQESSAVLSQHTLFALGDRRHEFNLEPMGVHTIMGKMEKLLVYRLLSQ